MTLLPPDAIDENSAISKIRYLEAYLKNVHNVIVYWGLASSFCYELRNRWEIFNERTGASGARSLNKSPVGSPF